MIGFTRISEFHFFVKSPIARRKLGLFQGDGGNGPAELMFLRSFSETCMARAQFGVRRSLWFGGYTMPTGGARSQLDELFDLCT